MRGKELIIEEIEASHGYPKGPIEGVATGKAAIGVRVGGSATVTVVCYVRIHDQLTHTRF